MEAKSRETSRKERRKEGRAAKSKKKFDSWVKNQREKSSWVGSKENQKKLPKVKAKDEDTEKRREVSDLKMNQASERDTSVRKPSLKKCSNNDTRQDGTRKTKFFEYLQRELDGNKILAEEDMAMERKLAKKLKVKNGKLGMANDDLEYLLGGIPSVSESPKKNQESQKPAFFASSTESDDGNSQDEDLEDEISLDDVSGEYSDEENNGEGTETESQENELRENDDSIDMFPAGDLQISNSLDDDTAHDSIESPKNETSNGVLGKYVAPHLRSCRSNESAEHVQMRNRLRGLLNRLSETNLEGITREVSSLFRSVGRSVGSEIISEEVVTSCSKGPRGNEQYAAVFAAFVAGMACLVGIEFGAKILARLAKCFEEEYMKEDNISLRNATLLLSYLYVFGVCSSELIYDFLTMLGKRLTEVDVSTVLTVLQCCGMKLRGDDPLGMKNFISSVQTRANELKASSSGDGKSNIYNKRIEFMIETICDIKNNRKKTKEEPLHHTQIKNWLRRLKVEDILLQGLKWQKLLDPNKKGQWWLSGDTDIASTLENKVDFASSFNQDNRETTKMLKVAASQGMNTDARRAIFCVIMFGGGDPVDTFENLLRIKLPGKQDREIMRVLVHCCLEEKVFNKYFCILASKLCSFDKNHKFSLQFCLWDNFKELDNMPLRRSVRLSEFTAEMIASFTLSLAVLKVVDLNETSHLSPKRIFHFGLLFKRLLEFPDELVLKIFGRIAVVPECESLRSGIEFFIREYVLKDQKALANKFRSVKRALKQC